MVAARVALFIEQLHARYSYVCACACRVCTVRTVLLYALMSVRQIPIESSQLNDGRSMAGQKAVNDDEGLKWSRLGLGLG